MKVEINRTQFFDDRTIGNVYINDEWFCYSLEDTDRKLEEGGEKIYGKTCIPRGRYKLTIDYSNRFKRDMPHILEVPQFTGIRIHSGNRPEDTEGCPLLGMEYNEQDKTIRISKVAFVKFFAKLKEAIDKKEDCWIHIT